MVTKSAATQFIYGDQPSHVDPKQALRNTIDKIKNNLFRPEGITDEDINIEIIGASIANTRGKKRHPAFKTKKNFQLGAPYMYISAGTSGFTVRLSTLPLTSSDQEVKDIIAFNENAKIIEQSALSSGFENIKIGTKEFRSIIELVKPGFHIRVSKTGKDKNYRGRSNYTMALNPKWKEKIAWKDLPFTGVSREFIEENLDVILNLFRDLHSVSMRNVVITSKEYEQKWKDSGWKAEKTTGEDKYNLVKDNAGRKIIHTTPIINSEYSKTKSALRKLIMTNQFKTKDTKNAKGEVIKKGNTANRHIKAVRYVSKAKRRKNQLYNTSGITPKSVLWSEGTIFNIIRQRFKRLNKQYPGFPSVENANINEENYMEFIGTLEEYVSRNPKAIMAKKTLEQLKGYINDYSNEKMSTEDIDNLLKFNEQGISDFGDQTYLRKPLPFKTIKEWGLKSKNIEELIESASKHVTSNLEDVRATELHISMEGLDNDTDTDTDN